MTRTQDKLSSKDNILLSRCHPQVIYFWISSSFSNLWSWSCRISISTSWVSLPELLTFHFHVCNLINSSVFSNCICRGYNVDVIFTWFVLHQSWTECNVPWHFRSCVIAQCEWDFFHFWLELWFVKFLCPLAASGTFFVLVKLLMREIEWDGLERDEGHYSSSRNTYYIRFVEFSCWVRLNLFFPIISSGK